MSTKSILFFESERWPNFIIVAVWPQSQNFLLSIELPLCLKKLNESTDHLLTLNVAMTPPMWYKSKTQQQHQTHAIWKII